MASSRRTWWCTEAEDLPAHGEHRATDTNADDSTDDWADEWADAVDAFGTSLLLRPDEHDG
ncbi:MAG: hypothetical protein ABIN79_00515 [Marmoricola sp.]